jgi:TatD DNase family protein
LNQVLSRSFDSGVNSIIVTAGNLKESKAAQEFCSSIQTPVSLYTTVGIHPTNANQGQNSKIYDELIILAAHPKVVAIGEFGLDYDRLEFCSKEIQKTTFIKQLSIVKSCQKPMFLHCRNAAQDLISILKEYHDYWSEGVVHSFDGTLQEAQEFMSMGLYIGINGCSLKTAENLDIVSQLPLSKIMIESDAPWCGIKKTHASFQLSPLLSAVPLVKKEKFLLGSRVKDRNEPASCLDILHVLSKLFQRPLEELSETIYQNTVKCFFSGG